MHSNTNVINNSFIQISLIDRVHKIYNDTVWQDRPVSIPIIAYSFLCSKNN